MKKLTAAVLLITLSLLTGCYKQDYSICDVEENCVLLFELEATSGSAEFTNIISSIDVALFDRNGIFTTHARVEKAQLDVFQGVKLTVDPGLYYVVAWGNVSKCSELSTANGVPPTAFTGSYLQTVSNETGCNLFYAPSKDVELFDPLSNSNSDIKIYEVDVKPNIVNRKELNFIRANRRVRVFLKDFDVAAHVELGKIPDRYDYYLRAFPSRKNYTRTTQKVQYEPTDEILDMSEFRAPIVPFEDAMTVNIVKTGTRAGEVLKTINLKEWYEQNKSTIKDINEISILFTQGAAGIISVEAVNWDDKQVGPIWK